MKGTLEASSQQQTQEILQEMRLTVNSISQAKQEKPKTAIGRNEFILFNQQLASITKAGIPLERGLKELVRDVQNRSLKKLINDVVEDLEKGIPIEQAISQRQKHFPHLYDQILQAGVKTGRLSEMLISLNRHLEVTQQTRKLIFEAMCYPLVILTLASVILTSVFLLIVPHFKEIFSGFDIELPYLTQVFLNLPEFVLPFWVIVFTVLFGLVLLKYSLSLKKKGRKITELVLLRVPIIGRIHHLGVLSRLADVMALLIGAGNDLSACFRLSANISGSEILKQESEIVASQLEQGNNIMEAGQFCRLIPNLFLYSIQLGSQRNELQDNLYSLSDMYSQQIRYSQGRLSSVLLPLMIIVVGGIVGLAVLSMFLPMVHLVSDI